MMRSKKAFVLLLAAMILVTLASVVLVLAGHEVLVRDAFRWVASSAENALEVAALIVVVLLVVVVSG